LGIAGQKETETKDVLGYETSGSIFVILQEVLGISIPFNVA
jgi:hypothetical protein